MMPPHLHYVEPYFGGGSVLLAKDPEGVSEVVNDVNGDLACFWRVLQDEYTFKIMRRRLEATPFSERAWREADESCSLYRTHVRADDLDEDDQISLACHFFVWCRQSLAGRMKSFTGVTKTRTRRGMNNEVSAWLTAVEGLPAVHARLKRVMILSRDATDVIAKHDGEKTLFFVDPPYLHETRAAADVYDHEMSAAKHEELLALLKGLRGKFLLSGYRSGMYDSAAKTNGWNRRDFEIANHSAGGKSKRVMCECVWSNFDTET